MASNCNLCEGNQLAAYTQGLGEFKYGVASGQKEPCLTSGEIINYSSENSSGQIGFNRKHYNALISYIQDAYGYGEVKNFEDKCPVEHETREYIYADTFNNILKALEQLQYISQDGNIQDENASITLIHPDTKETLSSAISNQTIVYGWYFKALEDYINTQFKINPHACRRCVTDEHSGGCGQSGGMEDCTSCNCSGQQAIKPCGDIDNEFGCHQGIAGCIDYCINIDQAPGSGGSSSGGSGSGSGGSDSGGSDSGDSGGSDSGGSSCGDYCIIVG